MKKLLCLSNANNATLLKIPKQAGIITSILLAFSPVMSANGNPVAEPEIVVQVSQEAGKLVRYSHIFKNFLQFVVIHTVKGFSTVNKQK